MKVKSLMVAVMGLLLAVAVFAQRGGGPRGGFEPGQFPATSDGTRPEAVDPLVAVQTALGLSAAQVESARALLTAQRTSIQPVMEEIRAKRQALRTLQQSGTASTTDLGNALAAVQAAEAKLTAIHNKFIADFDNLLTSDQKKLLADTRAAAERIPALARIGLIGGGPDFGPGGPGGRGGPRR